MRSTERVKSRFIAILLVVTLSSAAMVSPAIAEEEEGIWGQWADQITDRESPWEIPLVIIATVPAMMVITPFWLGGKAIRAIRGDEK